MNMRGKSREFWLIFISFFVIYFVWGSSYLANAWGVKSVPPFLYAGIRFSVAGAIILLISRLRGPIKVTAPQLRNATFAGFFLFAVGNGAMVWALQYVDSGLCALVVAFEPLLVLLLMWKMKGQKPVFNSWIGIALAMIGMLFLVGQPQLVTGPEWVFGVMAILMAISSWGYISIWMTKSDMPRSVFLSAGLQMLIGGIALLILSLISSEAFQFDWVQFGDRAFWALIYLIIFGSILAFTCFNYLLTKVSPTNVATATYINPVVAVFLGWWLNNEGVTGQSLFSAFLLLTGVLFINGHIPLWKKNKEVVRK